MLTRVAQIVVSVFALVIFAVSIWSNWNTSKANSRVDEANAILARKGGGAGMRLMPGGMHPWMDPRTQGFCVLLTSAIRERQPSLLVHLSNAVAAAFV